MSSTVFASEVVLNRERGKKKNKILTAGEDDHRYLEQKASFCSIVMGFNFVVWGKNIVGQRQDAFVRSDFSWNFNNSTLGPKGIWFLFCFCFFDRLDLHFWTVLPQLGKTLNFDAPKFDHISSHRGVGFVHVTPLKIRANTFLKVQEKISRRCMRRNSDLFIGTCEVNGCPRRLCWEFDCSDFHWPLCNCQCSGRAFRNAWHVCDHRHSSGMKNHVLRVFNHCWSSHHLWGVWGPERLCFLTVHLICMCHLFFVQFRRKLLGRNSWGWTAWCQVVLQRGQDPRVNVDHCQKCLFCQQFNFWVIFCDLIWSTGLVVRKLSFWGMCVGKLQKFLCFSKRIYQRVLSTAPIDILLNGRIN